jgi:hypothetical protein
MMHDVIGDVPPCASLFGWAAAFPRINECLSWTRFTGAHVSRVPKVQSGSLCELGEACSDYAFHFGCIRSVCLCTATVDEQAFQ